MAEIREHPVSVQSVPIEEFGLSQKLRVTLQLAGVIASVVAPADSSGVAASDGAGALVVTSAEAPLFALSGSGVGSSAHAYKVSNANARPAIRTIVFIDVLQCGANRDALHGCLVLPLPKQVVARVAVPASDEQRVARFLLRTTLHLQRTACRLVVPSIRAAVLRQKICRPANPGSPPGGGWVDVALVVEGNAACLDRLGCSLDLGVMLRVGALGRAQPDPPRATPRGRGRARVRRREADRGGLARSAPWTSLRSYCTLSAERAGDCVRVLGDIQIQRVNAYEETTKESKETTTG